MRSVRFNWGLLHQYDPNAIKVTIRGLTVGYLSRDNAKQLAGKKIDKTVPAVIDGGWFDPDCDDIEDREGFYGVKLGINSLNNLL